MFLRRQARSRAHPALEWPGSGGRRAGGPTRHARGERAGLGRRPHAPPPWPREPGRVLLGAAHTSRPARGEGEGSGEPWREVWELQGALDLAVGSDPGRCDPVRGERTDLEPRVGAPSREPGVRPRPSRRPCDLRRRRSPPVPGPKRLRVWVGIFRPESGTGFDRCLTPGPLPLRLLPLKGRRVLGLLLSPLAPLPRGAREGCPVPIPQRPLAPTPAVGGRTEGHHRSVNLPSTPRPAWCSAARSRPAREAVPPSP